MRKILILLLLALSSCISTKNKANPVMVKQEAVQFENIDLDSDGEISKKEIDVFNKFSLNKNSTYETKAPIWITVGIIFLTLLMCLVSSWVKCSKSE